MKSTREIKVRGITEPFLMPTTGVKGVLHGAAGGMPGWVPIAVGGLLGAAATWILITVLDD